MAVTPDARYDGEVTNRSPGHRQRSRKARRLDARRTFVTVDDVRSVASTLPRSYEAVVRGRVKFRVGRIVYVAFERDETILGFGFPKELRDALVESAPDKFLLPRQSDLRYNWVCVRLDAVDRDELWALVVSAWRMCVPKKVAAAYERQLSESRSVGTRSGR
jgi:hypothetical protein